MTDSTASAPLHPVTSTTVFEPDQVLRAEHLNGAFGHLDSEIRATRVLVTGAGILDGLGVRWLPRAGERAAGLEIMPGAAITTDGHLLRLEAPALMTHAAPYRGTDEAPWPRAWGAMDDDVWSLTRSVRPGSGSTVPVESVTRPPKSRAGFVVILYLERAEVAAGPCATRAGDADEGRRRSWRLRVLLAPALEGVRDALGLRSSDEAETEPAAPDVGCPAPAFPSDPPPDGERLDGAIARAHAAAAVEGLRLFQRAWPTLREAALGAPPPDDDSAEALRSIIAELDRSAPDEPSLHRALDAFALACDLHAWRARFAARAARSPGETPTEAPAFARHVCLGHFDPRRAQVETHRWRHGPPSMGRATTRDSERGALLDIDAWVTTRLRCFAAPDGREPRAAAGDPVGDPGQSGPRLVVGDIASPPEPPAHLPDRDEVRARWRAAARHVSPAHRVGVHLFGLRGASPSGVRRALDHVRSAAVHVYTVDLDGRRVDQGLPSGLDPSGEAALRYGEARRGLLATVGRATLALQTTRSLGDESLARVYRGDLFSAWSGASAGLNAALPAEVHRARYRSVVGAWRGVLDVSARMLEEAVLVDTLGDGGWVPSAAGRYHAMVGARLAEVRAALLAVFAVDAQPLLDATSSAGRAGVLGLLQRLPALAHAPVVPAGGTVVLLTRVTESGEATVVADFASPQRLVPLPSAGAPHLAVYAEGGVEASTRVFDLARLGVGGDASLSIEAEASAPAAALECEVHAGFVTCRAASPGLHWARLRIPGPDRHRTAGWIDIWFTARAAPLFALDVVRAVSAEPGETVRLDLTTLCLPRSEDVEFRLPEAVEGARLEADGRFGYTLGPSTRSPVSVEYVAVHRESGAKARGRIVLHRVLRASESGKYRVRLLSCGAKKIPVIKAIRAITGLGLKEAKRLVDGVPTVVDEKLSKVEADAIAKQLDEAGAETRVERE